MFIMEVSGKAVFSTAVRDKAIDKIRSLSFGAVENIKI